MPIRITSDYKVQVAEGLPCWEQPINYSNTRNVKAMQSILNLFTNFYWDNRISLPTYTPLVVDGIYGSKTKARLNEIFGNQKLTKCNVFDAINQLPSMYTAGLMIVRADLLAVTVTNNPTDPVDPEDPTFIEENNFGKILLPLAAFVIVAKWQKWI